MEKDFRTPEGYEKHDCYVKDGEVVVMANSNIPEEHSCDEMGCGSLDHVLFRINTAALSRQREEIAGEVEGLKMDIGGLPSCEECYDKAEARMIEELNSKLSALVARLREGKG